MTACVLGVVAPSGSGKTTLLERVIPLLRARGLRVAALKHSHHTVEMDKPGKDSYRLRQAGADAVLLAGPTGWSFIVEGEDDVDTLLRVINALHRVDIILVEGLRAADIPRLEVYRAALGQAPRYLQDPHIIAIASDGLPGPVPLPVLDLNRPECVADFILAYVQARRSDTLDSFAEGTPR
ncbi:MAG: molybdopterin-guanine dinucleotide biosynthesis protein B [Gammaproteobacteria bacterium]|nr:molybdopterin-guanine dinucleotide biosynthesis protein B [Gammaproteobacteria bacterium]